MRIGLGVASDHLCAVSVRAGDVQWAIEADRSPNGDLADDIVVLLRRTSLPRWPRPDVVAAIGPAASQTKRLTGLPTMAGEAALRSIVRESTPRFFLRNGIPLVISGVRVEEEGALWAVAFELPEVRAIEAACRTLGLRLRMIVPSVVALPLALEGVSTEWTDGSTRSEIVFANGKMSGTRRLTALAATDTRNVGAPTAVAALRRLGEGAWRHADAYGATQVRDDEPLALRSSSGDLDAGGARRGVRVAAVALCLAMVVALGAPLVTRAVQARRITRQLAALSARSHEAEHAEIDLARMSSALFEVARFASSRRSTVRLLAQLTHALPEGSVLVTVRVDSAGGIVSLLAPRASSALASLDSVGHVNSPEIIGPVTKELVGTRELERATVQFRFDSTSWRAQ
jgi:hypothetical protein